MKFSIILYIYLFSCIGLLKKKLSTVNTLSIDKKGKIVTFLFFCKYSHYENKFFKQATIDSDRAWNSLSTRVFFVLSYIYVSNVLQHTNARQLTNIQDDREFQALSESIVAFLRKFSCRNNEFKKKTSKATKNADFSFL